MRPSYLNIKKTKYLIIDHEYETKTGEKAKVSFMLPESFITKGDLDGWSLTPENFLGVNLKTLLENSK